MRGPRRALAAAQVALLLALPRLALACPSCISGREEDTRAAFLLTTVFLSVFPLTALGGFLWWLRRRARAVAAEAEHAAHAPAARI
jgi:hypothetical protein